jgi:hypothetical protein
VLADLVERGVQPDIAHLFIVRRASTRARSDCRTAISRPGQARYEKILGLATVCSAEHSEAKGMARG